MGSRRWLDSGVLGTAAVTFSAGVFFAKTGAQINAVGILAPFFGCLWLTVWLPGRIAYGFRPRGNPPGRGGKLKNSVLYGAAAIASVSLPAALSCAIFAPGGGFQEIAFNAAGAAAITLAFCGLAAGVGRLVGSFFPENGRARADAGAATVFTFACLLSPFLTGGLLDSADDFTKLFLVWLSPAAMLGAALPELNFSCLPGLYHIWMGSLCPVPHHFWMAAGVYAVPAVFIWLFSRWRDLWK